MSRAATLGSALAFEKFSYIPRYRYTLLMIYNGILLLYRNFVFIYDI